MSVARSNAARQTAETATSAPLAIAGLVGISVLCGVALALAKPVLILAGAAGLALCCVCLRWPYAGFVIYKALDYIRPAERFPSLDPLHISRLVAVLVVIGWLMRRRRDGFATWVSGPENAAVIFFLLVVLASIPGAFWKARAFDVFTDVARMVVIYFMMVDLINTPKRMAIFLLVFVGLNAFLSGEQLFNYITHGPSPHIVRVGSASGSFLGEDGDFAMALCVALPFAYFLAWSSMRRFWRAACAIAGLMFVGSIVATGSRGGFCALIAVMLLVAARSRRKLLATALIVLLLGGAWLASPPIYKHRMETIVTMHGTDPSARDREISWAAARRMFADYPLLGVGAGNFYFTFVAQYGGSYTVNKTVHDVYLQAASEMGVFGLIALLYLLGVLLYRSVSVHVRITGSEFKGTPVAACAAAVLPSVGAYMVSGAFQTPLFYPHLFLLASLVLCADNIARSESAGQGRSQAEKKWSKWNNRSISRVLPIP